MKRLYLLSSFLFTFLSKVLSQGQDSFTGIEMDWQEKDKILACVEIVSKKFNTDLEIINKLASSVNVPKDQFTSKISGEMLSSCYNRIDDATVRGIFQNLTIVDIDWHDSYESLVKLDYTRYKPAIGQAPNMEMTPEQQILFYKLEKAREEFIAINRVKQQLQAQTISVFGYDLSKIKGEIKIFYMLGVFALFIFGIIFLLNKLKKTTGKGKIKKK